MSRFSRILAPLALAAFVAVAVAGAGEEQPGREDKKKTEKKADDRKDAKKADDKKGPAPKPDPAVEAWLRVLLEKITDPHDTVRESARGAVVAVGPPAIPALQKLADGDDAAKAVAAHKLIMAIHHHHGRHAMQHGPDHVGPMHMGPWGHGFGPGMWHRGPMGPGHRKDDRKDEKKDKRDEDEAQLAPMPRVAQR